MSLARQLILENDADIDPKEFAMQRDLDSELFRDFMRNYQDACRTLLKQAKTCGALDGSEQEGHIIRAVMQIAAKQFQTNTDRQLLKNLERFI